MSEKIKGRSGKRKFLPIVIILAAALLIYGIYYIFRYPLISWYVERNSDSVAEIPVENDNTSNILIAYFTLGENSDVDAVTSASVTVVDRVAKANVRAVADMIQEKTNGDIISIQTVKDYDKSYFTAISQAKEEMDNNEFPELENKVKNIDSYDVIFLGYPTWWFDAPRAVYSFLDEYDLSGKTIIPFNSANGSKFADSIETIKKLEPDAEILEGISVDQGDAEDSKDEVYSWLEKLGY